MLTAYDQYLFDFKLNLIYQNKDACILFILFKTRKNILKSKNVLLTFLLGKLHQQN